MLGREATAIPFSADAMRASLLRLEEEWETVQASRDRDAVYGYLSVVFETVMAWTLEGRAVNRASQALRLRGYSSVRQPEPFAALILGTADRDKVDDRTRSKWSRVSTVRGGIQGSGMSRCVILSSAEVESTNARRGLPGRLGRHRRYVRRWLGASRKHSRRPRTSVPVRTNLRRRQVIL